MGSTGKEQDARRIREVGELIKSKSQSIADLVMDCQERKDNSICNRYDDLEISTCRRDTIYHLQYLSTALQFSSKILFESYLEWLKVLMSSLDISTEDLITNYVCMEEAIEETLQPDVTDEIQDFLESGLNRLQGEADDVVTHFGENVQLSVLATQYLNTLLKGEVETAMKLVVDAAKKGSSLRDLYLEVFAATQYELGRLWLTGEISVAQEHYCTAATQLVMSQLYPYMSGGVKRGRRVFLTCVQGELHDMGLRILKDFFVDSGWDTVFVGCNTPKESIVSLVEKTRPDVIAISVTMSYNLQELEELINLIRKTESISHVRIMVGGNPFNLDPELWRVIGADAHAKDAEDAVRTAITLVGN